MRNAVRGKEWGDDFSLNFLCVSFTVVIVIVLLGVMNSMTLDRVQAMKRYNGRPKLVLVGPASEQRVVVNKNLSSPELKSKKSNGFVLVNGGK
jgi:hypothetical protein